MTQIKTLLSSLSIVGALLFVPASAQIRHVAGFEPTPQPAPAELTASDGAAWYELGIAVAASANTVVVGQNCLEIAVGFDCEASLRTAVYLYERPRSGWGNMVQTAELTPSDDPGMYFGLSVAISCNTVVVGARNKVYVFVKPPEGWKNMAETAQLDLQSADGYGVQVSIDKDTIVVGVGAATVHGNQGQGAAYVFVEPPTGWVTTSRFNAELTASDGSFRDDFGQSTAINGNTIVVGAPFHNDQAGPGESYVFEKPSTGWSTATQTAILTRSNPGPYDEFGFAVAISGNTVVVGAPQASGINKGQGVVDVFVKPLKGWTDTTETAELVAPVYVQSFGGSVATEGRNVTVGAFSMNNLVFVYAKPSKGGWKSTSHPRTVLMAGDSGSWFGFSVAMTKSIIVAGAPLETVDGRIYQGAAYVFGRPWMTPVSREGSPPKVANK